MRRALMVIATVAATALGTSVWVHAQDRKTVDPSMKILLENEYVRVQEHFIRPGQKVEMHSHPHYVVYATTDWKARFTYPDGTIREGAGKAGSAAFSEPLAHAVENIGSAEQRNIVVELKERPKTNCLSSG